MAKWARIVRVGDDDSTFGTFFTTSVMKVPGGMIVRSTSTKSTALVFVPDYNGIEYYADGKPREPFTAENLLEKWIEDNKVI
jgi:hypothetical protein